MTRWAALPALAAALLFVTLLNLTPIHSSDFWIQLAVGREIDATGEIPRSVLFAYGDVRDNEFVAHEWLPSLIAYRLYDAAGYTGAVVAKCGLALAIFGLALLLAWQAQRNLIVAIGSAAFCMLALNGRTRMRPELYAYGFLMLELLLLEAFRRRAQLGWLLGLIPVAVAWANFHGSFLVGLTLAPMTLLGVVIDDRQRRPRPASPERLRERLRGCYLPLAGISIALVIASLATPHGLRLFTHALELGANAYFRENILEWFPTFHPAFESQPFFRIYLIGGVLIAVSALVGARRLGAVWWIRLVFFGALSTFAIRHTGWIALVAVAPLAICWGPRLDSGPARLRSAVVLTVLLCAASALVGSVGNVRGLSPGFERGSPLGDGALAHLREDGASGNVFNAYNLGDELVFHFYPELRVAMDSRADAYGVDHYQRYITLSGRSLRRLAPPEALLAHLERYDIRTIVTRPYNLRNWKSKGTIEALDAAGWRPTYHDDDNVVLRRLPDSS
jgi:hypothetical protein